MKRLLLIIAILVCAGCSSSGSTQPRATPDEVPPSPLVSVPSDTPTYNPSTEPGYATPEPGEAPLSTAAQALTKASCLRWDEHEAVVCAAYYYASYGPRLAYYKLGSGDNQAAAAALQLLQHRYVDDAMYGIGNEVSDFPRRVNVSIPRITITAITANLAANTAILQTRESWKITDRAGHVLFQESAEAHTVTMRRVQRPNLQRWVVAKIA